jgi:hypothetical protein
MCGGYLMKRYIAVVLAAMLIMICPAKAVRLENTDSVWVNGVYTESFNNDPEAQAEMLKALGLFKGTDKGFELDRNMTRAEAAVMFVRFLGAEQSVQNGTWKHPFTDVPVWADKYVGWLYRSGLTKGIGGNRYGAKNNITMKQYAVFLSRAICGDDNWLVNGIASEEEVNLCDNINHIFTRAAAVGLTARALTITYTKNGNYTYSMAQYLVDHNVFTAAQLLNAAWGVLPAAYLYLDDQDYLYNTIAGVAVAKSDVGGLHSFSGEDSAQTYFYAAASSDKNLSLYKIDCKTMKTVLISCKAISGDASSWYYEYLNTIDGKDYLLEYSYVDSTINFVE